MANQAEQRRAQALEGMTATVVDPAEQLVAERLRTLLGHPGTWLTAPDIPMTAIVEEPPPAVVAAPEPAVDQPVVAKRRIRPRWRWALGAGGVVAGAAAAAVLAVAVLVPDQEATDFRLRATADGDGARASVAAVAMDAGWHLTVYIDGLPPAPADMYYEGWLVTNGSTVSLGTFHMRKPGAVEWWSGVKLTEASTVIVTRQRLGGPLEPGVVLMTGVIPPF